MSSTTQPADLARPNDGQRTCLASLDASLNVVAADAWFLQRFGAASSEICGRSIYELLHPTAALDHHFARLTDGDSLQFTERVTGMCGPDEGFSAELTGIAVHGDVTSVACTVVMRPDAPCSFPPDESPARHSRMELTPLGAKILEGVARGASTEQLATRLYLSRQGVDYHVTRMLRRLRVPNRAALVARAHSKGMFAPGVWPPKILPGFVTGYCAPEAPDQSPSSV